MGLLPGAQTEASERSIARTTAIRPHRLACMHPVLNVAGIERGQVTEQSCIGARQNGRDRAHGVRCGVICRPAQRWNISPTRTSSSSNVVEAEVHGGDPRASRRPTSPWRSVPVRCGNHVWALPRRPDPQTYRLHDELRDDRGRVESEMQRPKGHTFPTRRRCPSIAVGKTRQRRSSIPPRTL